MRTPSNTRSHRPGYVSLIAVFTISIFMLSLMLFAYERAVNAQAIQSDIQTQTDYREKEETILRSIVAITPNRAIRSMQTGSFSNTNQVQNPLSFRNIFSDALSQSNARQSIPTALRDQLNIPDSYSGNSGDSNLATINRMFRSQLGNSGFVTGGLNRDLGAGFPPALNSNNSIANDDFYPVISKSKTYGGYASGEVGLSTSIYKDFNLIPYPNINFGYATPGQPFVAKRNWWAFSMDLADYDDDVTKLARFKRRFVLSIYEIPSQLPISASSFMALGSHANGDAWENITIDGPIFAGKALVEGTTSLPTLATRRGADLSDDSTIGGQSFNGNPFTPGVRETFRLTEGDFFPISLASESGKAAFVPINRGADYFDRFAHAKETVTVSPTGWNEYSVGALNCAMNLDVTQCVSNSDSTPTQLKFTYYKNGAKTTLTMSLNGGNAAGLPIGYIKSVGENNTAYFDSPVDVAYGENGKFYYIDNVSGSIRFDNQTFGDPIVGTYKYGWYKPVYPFSIKQLPSGKTCVAFFPERLKKFLTLLGADGLDKNNSISINVDYVNSTRLQKPFISNAVNVTGSRLSENDYGVILQECGDLSGFTKGFSLVTNLRLYIGDDFNVVGTTPPAGYTPPTGTFYPPASLFSPEKRYGVDFDPFAVEMSGQIGSVASDTSTNPVRPMDATGVSGTSMAAYRIKMNLSTISHPAELPPIFMMNWLILLEEKRAEFD